MSSYLTNQGLVINDAVRCHLAAVRLGLRRLLGWRVAASPPPTPPRSLHLLRLGVAGGGCAIGPTRLGVAAAPPPALGWPKVPWDGAAENGLPLGLGLNAIFRHQALNRMRLQTRKGKQRRRLLASYYKQVSPAQEGAASSATLAQQESKGS